jgi:hypothetical protein
MSEKPAPYAFISYSHTTPEYRERIIEIAKRLITDGVQVLIDAFHLRHGNDMPAFMERLTNDQSITHCLIFSDAKYAEKANAREGGVGVEAQIITSTLYSKIEQSKFVPIAMEQKDGVWCLPIYAKNRLGFDFTSVESMHRHWPELIRHLYGEPLHQPPPLGKRPSFLDSKVEPAFAQTKASLDLFERAARDGSSATALYRDEILENFMAELNAAEIALKSPAGGDASWDEQLRMHITGRDYLLKWLLLETALDARNSVNFCMIPLLESLGQFEAEDSRLSFARINARKLLAYELAFYFVAALAKRDNLTALASLLRHPFVEIASHDPEGAPGLREFYYYQETKSSSNAVPSFIKQRSTEPRLPFESLVEADAIIFAYNLAQSGRWWPALSGYTDYGKRFPWFVKARSDISASGRMAQLTGKTWPEFQHLALQWIHNPDNHTVRFRDAFQRGLCIG